MATLSVEKLLTDAHTLVIHLKDHDSLADSIIGRTTTLRSKVEAMKQVTHFNTLKPFFNFNNNFEGFFILFLV